MLVGRMVTVASSSTLQLTTFAMRVRKSTILGRDSLSICVMPLCAFRFCKLVSRLCQTTRFWHWMPRTMLPPWIFGLKDGAQVRRSSRCARFVVLCCRHRVLQVLLPCLPSGQSGTLSVVLHIASFKGMHRLKQKVRLQGLCCLMRICQHLSFNQTVASTVEMADFHCVVWLVKPLCYTYVAGCLCTFFWIQAQG